jgi:hypothetical protein
MVMSQHRRYMAPDGQASSSVEHLAQGQLAALTGSQSLT